MAIELPGGVGPNGPVANDLFVTCEGCKFKSLQGVCLRFPPIFKPATPVKMPNGEIGTEIGGWAMPPAIRKCGEFVKGEFVS